MAFYRKKPIVIEARQFDGSDESGWALARWMKAIRSLPHPLILHPISHQVTIAERAVLR